MNIKRTSIKTEEAEKEVNKETWSETEQSLKWTSLEGFKSKCEQAKDKGQRTLRQNI